MILFSFLYIAVSHTAHIHYFSCHISIVSCHLCITFLNLSLNSDSVGECCKAQWVCVDQRIALYKSYLLLLQ